jgi:hypothetical protein
VLSDEKLDKTGARLENTTQKSQTMRDLAQENSASKSLAALPTKLLKQREYLQIKPQNQKCVKGNLRRDFWKFLMKYFTGEFLRI